MGSALDPAALHEAAHAIVGMACGRRLVSVSVSGHEGYTAFKPIARDHPCVGGSILRIKRLLTGTVAGYVAEAMHFGGWPKRLRISEAVRRHGLDGGGPEMKYTVKLAKAIREGQALKDATRRAWESPNGQSPVTKPTKADIVSEIERAEERAERILRRRWDDVLRLTLSLSRRKSRRMTGAQALALLRSRKGTP
jgi:hypothetical protein